MLCKASLSDEQFVSQRLLKWGKTAQFTAWVALLLTGACPVNPNHPGSKDTSLQQAAVKVEWAVEMVGLPGHPALAVLLCS